MADYHQYPIADNDSPQLSADRLEYTLGNAIAFQAYPLVRLQALVDDLAVSADEHGQPELVFRSFARAKEFARLALINSWIYVADEDQLDSLYLDIYPGYGNTEEGVAAPYVKVK